MAHNFIFIFVNSSDLLIALNSKLERTCKRESIYNVLASHISSFIKAFDVDYIFNFILEILRKRERHHNRLSTL